MSAAATDDRMTSRLLMSTCFMFLKDVCLNKAFFPHDKTIPPMTCYFFFFYFSKKKLLSVHLFALCNEPEHVKDLLKNPENLVLTACCSDRAKTFSTGPHRRQNRVHSGKCVSLKRSISKADLLRSLDFFFFSFKVETGLVKAPEGITCAVQGC